MSDDRSYKLPDFDKLEKVDIDEDVSHVLVSFDRDVTIDKIVRAAEYVKNGATFLATNLDPVLHLKEKVKSAGLNLTCEWERMTSTLVTLTESVSQRSKPSQNRCNLALPTVYRKTG